MFSRVVVVVLIVHLAQSEHTRSRKLPKGLGMSQTYTESFSGNCGGVLKTNFAAIKYKPFDIVEPNERCVWTMSAPNATSYFIAIFSLGSPSSLTITTLGLDTFANHTRPDEVPYHATFDNVNALLITFHPGNNPNHTRGFSLEMDGSYVNGGTVANSSSEHVVAPATTGSLRYPKERNGPGNYELSTFVITPIIGCNGTFKRTDIVYATTEAFGSTIFIYGFKTSSSGIYEWTYLGDTWGDYGMHKISNRDLILITFKSYDKVRTSGFQIYTDVNEP